MIVLHSLKLIVPGEPSERLQKMIEYSIKGYNCDVVKSVDKIKDIKDEKVLFAVELGETGINIGHYNMLHNLLSNMSSMQGCIGSVLINSENELFSREVARKTILYSNMAGCMFPGRPLCEATGSLKNLSTYKKNLKQEKSLEEILLIESQNVVKRLVNFKSPQKSNPKILAIHASNYKTSNTLSLWNKVKSHLSQFQINEIHIENGSVIDCRGCSYKTCKHYSESVNCFYGGVMVEEVYPAIIEADALVMICPNYNDAISANLTATINRLTSLFHKTKFYDKYLFSIVVSGFSGGDIIASQLISALNINKTFILPQNFALLETANDYGDLEKIVDIDKKAKAFADNMKSSLVKF